MPWNPHWWPVGVRGTHQQDTLSGFWRLIADTRHCIFHQPWRTQEKRAMQCSCSLELCYVPPRPPDWGRAPLKTVVFLRYIACEDGIGTVELDSKTSDRRSALFKSSVYRWATARFGASASVPPPHGGRGRPRRPHGWVGVSDVRWMWQLGCTKTALLAVLAAAA